MTMLYPRLLCQFIQFVLHSSLPSLHLHTDEPRRPLFFRSDRVNFHPTEPWLDRPLQPLQPWSRAIVEVPVRCVKFIARKNWFVAGSDDFRLRMFNYNTHEKVAAFEVHPDYIQCLTYILQASTSIVLTGSDDVYQSSIKAWDWDSKWTGLSIQNIW